MSAPMIAAISGAAIGIAGCALVLTRNQPVPDLKDVAARLHPPAGAYTRVEAGDDSLWHRVGHHVQQSSLGSRIRVPDNDLAITGISKHRFLAEKALLAIGGFTLMIILGVILTGAVPIPAYLYPVAGLAVGTAFFMMPDVDLRRKAATARDEFNRALCSYIDLVALGRRSGIGSTQALENAAAVGDGLVFNRIREELALARLNRQTPWDALDLLADQLGLKELSDVAGIMRTTTERASVYEALRARSAGLRNTILSKDLEQANAVSAGLDKQTAILGLIFLALLITPPLSGITG